MLHHLADSAGKSFGTVPCNNLEKQVLILTQWANRRQNRNNLTHLESMVGAGRFERPTPCAQGSFRHSWKVPYFQLLTFQADTVLVLKPVEPC